ncbi:MAG: hypothetical protein H6742_21095 [Alphaproteobacteria bacterium]|nr:hypothetical protein [Alphaproteobacteria bacterium]
MARRPLSLLAASLGLLLTAAPAAAQDDDFDFIDDDSGTEDDEDGGKAIDAPPEEEDDEFDFTEPTDDVDPLDDVDMNLEGVDTADIYRDYQAEVERLPPEEEAMAWGKYLRDYPNTQFRTRIEARVEKLEERMYDSRIVDEEERVEAGKAELNFAQPFTIENIDPRKKVRAGVEFGLPGYVAPILDFEYAFLRNLSAHAGVRGRYGGVSIEPGVKWAFVKSAKSKTIVAVLGDFRMNTNPTYVGIRPQLAAGQRITPGGGDLSIDVQAQFGTELVTYGLFSPRVVGGANVTVSPGDTVRFFFETNVYMKDLGWEEGDSFRFNVVSFGVKFLERNKTGADSRFEIGGGAIAPYSSSYWSFHSGAIGVDGHYYL